MRKKFACMLLVVSLLMLLTSSQLLGINSNAGTAAYSFLKMGVSARAAA